MLQLLYYNQICILATEETTFFFIAPPACCCPLSLFWFYIIIIFMYMDDQAKVLLWEDMSGIVIALACCQEEIKAPSDQPELWSAIYSFHSRYQRSDRPRDRH